MEGTAADNSVIPENVEITDSIEVDESSTAEEKNQSHPEQNDPGNARNSVSWNLRVGAAWSWRFLVVLGAVAAILYLMSYISSIVIAILVAMLLAMLLAPVVNFLKRKLNMGQTAAAAVGLLIGIFIVTVLLAIALTQLIQQLPQIAKESVEGIGKLLDWVADGPWGSEADALRQYLTDVQDDIMAFLKEHSTTIASEAIWFASSAVSLATNGLLMVFILFFFLKDGRQMWTVALRSMPKRWRNRVNEAAIRGWITLGFYVRTQTKVAAIDAAGIGIGAFALGVPMAFPITVLVFLCAFVPIVGAFVSGAVAILLALVNNGVTAAIIMFIIVLTVQQLEGNVLQPWLMSQAVSLHPVVVVLAVMIGGSVAGIAGAVFSVPLLAFLNVTTLYLHGHDQFPYLSEREDRPGGPPGKVNEQIEVSYREAQEKAKKARDKANEKSAKKAGKVSDASV